MQVNVTFKNADTNEEIKDRAAEKAQKIKKFLRSPIQVDFVFSTNSKLTHSAELIVSGDGHHLTASVDSADFFSAIDECMDKMVTQLKKHKDRVKQKKGNVKTSVLMSEPETEEIEE